MKAFPKILPGVIFFILSVGATLLGFVGYPIMFMAALGLFMLAIIAGWGGLLYKAPEDHLGIVYRDGQFNRFVDPNQWTLLAPFSDNTISPINLRMRSTHLREDKLFTKDYKILDINLMVHYSVNPRRSVLTELITEELHYTDATWETIVQQVTQSTLIALVLEFTSAELLTSLGLNEFRSRLSCLVSEQLLDVGVWVHDTHGVRILQLLPNREVMRALIEEDAGPTLGLAALERMQPLLAAMGSSMTPTGWQALLIGMASAVVNHEDLQRLESNPKFMKTVGDVKQP